MRIQVNNKLLSGKPFSNDSNDEIFEFDKGTLNKLKSDLRYNPEGAYLLTGFRGAGKTSLIRKVEKDFAEDAPGTLFIYLNFAKYEAQTFVLRKIIRALYFKCESINETGNAVNKAVFKDIARLYEQTFHDVAEESGSFETETQESEVKFSLVWTDLLFAGIGVLIMILGLFWLPTVDSLKAYAEEIKETSYLFSILGIIGSLAMIGIKAFNVNQQLRWTFLKTTTQGESKKELYDDEIAEQKLRKAIQALKTSGKKLVFVFDELDKIQGIENVRLLLNELKPLMLSGLANFIAVGGQEIHQAKLDARFEEDDPFNTLFSRTYYLRLATTDKIEHFLIQVFSKEGEGEEEEIDAWVRRYYEFNSHKIFRRLISDIRNDLDWERLKGQEEARAVIRIDFEVERRLNENKFHPAIYGELMAYINSCINFNLEQHPVLVDNYFLQDSLFIHCVTRLQKILNSSLDEDGNVLFEEDSESAEKEKAKPRNWLEEDIWKDLVEILVERELILRDENRMNHLWGYEPGGEEPQHDDENIPPEGGEDNIAEDFQQQEPRLGREIAGIEKLLKYLMDTAEMIGVTDRFQAIIDEMNAGDTSEILSLTLFGDESGAVVLDNLNQKDLLIQAKDLKIDLIKEFLVVIGTQLLGPVNATKALFANEGFSVKTLKGKSGEIMKIQVRNEINSKLFPFLILEAEQQKSLTTISARKLEKIGFTLANENKLSGKRNFLFFFQFVENRFDPRFVTQGYFESLAEEFPSLTQYIFPILVQYGKNRPEVNWNDIFSEIREIGNCYNLPFFELAQVRRDWKLDSPEKRNPSIHFELKKDNFLGNVVAVESPSPDVFLEHGGLGKREFKSFDHLEILLKEISFIKIKILAESLELSSGVVRKVEMIISPNLENSIEFENEKLKIEISPRIKYDFEGWKKIQISFNDILFQFNLADSFTNLELKAIKLTGVFHISYIKLFQNAPPKILDTFKMLVESESMK